MGLGGGRLPPGAPPEAEEFMPTPSEHSRSCPTRADGTEVLIAHRITEQTCQARQRGMYHKCFSCAFQNVTEQGTEVEPVRLPPPLRMDAAEPQLPTPSRVAMS